MTTAPAEPVPNTKGHWEAAYRSAPMRDAEAETLSGVPLSPVYGPEDWPGESRGTALLPGNPDPGGPDVWPGEYPYTRGPYASMYRSKLWTMRLFAGYGTAADTNARFHDLLRSGSDGLSVAFDLPTLMGMDSDDPLAAGEVGRCGVAVDTLTDVVELFEGIDLGSVSTSMTINAPAPILLAMYVAAAQDAGVDRRRLAGTLQNDILKEYQAQKEYVFPPGPSLRLVVDLIAYCRSELPKFHPVSVSGYHIREAGSTAVQELAYTLANGFAYVEAAISAGLLVDEFAPQLSFFFNAHIDLFEEVAKFRAARRLWARWMAERYGATNPRSMQCRFHTQTAGVSLTAQQPEVNIVRTAIEALAGVLGGTQSLHTNSMDEVLALPSEKAARIALRTQQVLAHETGVANVADPLGGSWYVESLTDELERQASAIFDQIDRWGDGSMLQGVLYGIEEGKFQSAIADSAYELERKVSSGRRIVVGVNAFTEGNDEPIPSTLHIDQAVEMRQCRRLAEVRRRRSGDAVAAALAQLAADAAVPDANLMPAVFRSVRADATVGEMMSTLVGVFGRWPEQLGV